MLIIVECSYHNPEATGDVAKDEEDDHEEKEPLQAVSNLQDIVQVLHEFTLLFHNLEKSQHLGELDQLVQLSKPRNPKHAINVAITH
jgi:hypothetical protein